MTFPEEHNQRSGFRGHELIVGIPSYMEADSIGFVTRQVDQGIRRYFPHLKALIVNVDNCSEDGTRDVFMSTQTGTQKKYISTPAGVLGKGSNFLNLFRFCQSERATLRAVVVVDADLQSITPEWVRYLAEPILEGYDYALPRYYRHQFDGTITNHICHPLIYGLLGENIRQPIGGEFAFSPALVSYWLEQRWLPSTKLYGIDIFMTMNALLGRFRLCEVGLGAKIHKPSAPKLGPMFTQVVTNLFDRILLRKAEWIGKPVVAPATKPLFGLQGLETPQELTVDLRDLKERLRDEFFAKQDLLKNYLSDYIYVHLTRMVELDRYDMDILMWTQSVYQLLFAFDYGDDRVKDDIVEALKPLYFARSLTFDYETWNCRIEYAEQRILDQAMAFASQKPYFYGLYLKFAHDTDKKAGDDEEGSLEAVAVNQ